MKVFIMIQQIIFKKMSKKEGKRKAFITHSNNLESEIPSYKSDDIYANIYSFTNVWFSFNNIAIQGCTDSIITSRLLQFMIK